MSKDIYHIDYETYSPVDIKKSGAFKYAEHPETQILIMAIARNDEPVKVWFGESEYGHEALDLYHEAIESGAEIWAHNAQFEYAITSHHGFPPQLPAVEQWHCTAALCRLAAIPSSLGDASEFLNLELPKDSEGKRLIQKFSVPQRRGGRIMPMDDPDDFQKFIDYCVRDVEAEREIHKKLKILTYSKHPSHASFTADLRMNARGIPVNLKALNHAKKLIGEYDAKLIPLFRSQVAEAGRSLMMPVTKMRKVEKPMPLDDGFNPSQGEMMKAWLKEEGFTGDDLQADTVDRWLAEPLASYLTPKAQAALKTYSLIGSAAVKKIPAMLNMASDDGYVRGALMIYGAERTHRWTGKGIQPQNFARPTIEFTRLAYDMICNGASIEELDSIFGDLYPIIVSCIRHFIQPHDGVEVLQADYSAIEARVAPWLVDEEETLEMFRQNKPIYEMMAARIFHKSVDDVTKDERFLGKQTVLGCSYNMGAAKFRSTCEGYGFTPPPAMVEHYKTHLHREYATREVNRVRNSVEREYEKKGKPVPAHYTIEKFKQMTCTKLGWKMPMTPADDDHDEWVNRTYSELADRAVKVWRENNPKIVASWRELDEIAKRVIQNPEIGVQQVGKLKLCCMNVGGNEDAFMALCIKLPSGHYLFYPKPSVVKNESRGWGTQIKFWGIMPNSGNTWGWCYTYGGKILENTTQATAGDIMREGMLSAERAGYEPFMLVHDEMLATKLNDSQTHEELCQLLCTMPEWAEGLPLAAEGSTIPFYEKG